MNFFKIIIFLIFATFSTLAIADNHGQDQGASDQLNEISNEMQDDEEVPLNDPFAGNEGQNRNSNIPEEEQDDEMSLYNFKLVGFVSGKSNAFITLVNSGGEVKTLTLNQAFGNKNKIKWVSFKESEAIFEKEDGKYIMINFDGEIREADEY